MVVLVNVTEPPPSVGLTVAVKVTLSAGYDGFWLDVSVVRGCPHSQPGVHEVCSSTQA